MKFFSTHISPKVVLNVLLGLAILGMILILLSVNRMNSILSTDMGFDKDSVISLKTKESTAILPDSLVFSSVLPGFNSEIKLIIRSEYDRNEIEIEHQFISDTYFDFFHYTKLNEKPSLFLDHGNAQLVYINESAAEKLGISSMDDALGTIISDEYDRNMIICGVVQDEQPLTLQAKKHAKIFQLTSEHLAFAFERKENGKLSAEKENPKAYQSGMISFQQRIQDRYKIWEDLIYSLFLFINVMILLICLGQVGSKYAYKSEGELFKIFGIGIHVISLLISKKYLSLISILALVVVPIAFLIHKLWLEVYIHRINFGLIDLLIILSMALFTLYLICCPKNKIDDQFKGKFIQRNSI